MYEVEFSEKAEKQMYKLPSDLQKRILLILERIKVRPYHFVKKLIGTKFYRLRVGKYRIILNIQNKRLIIYVIEVGHRRNVYK